MSSYVLGADVGTSCLKVVLIHPERGVISKDEFSYQMRRLTLFGQKMMQKIGTSR